MKLPTLLIGWCIVSYTNAFLLPEGEIAKEKDLCLQELHLDATRFRKMPNIRSDGFDVDQKCLLRCVLLKLGILGDDGKFDAKYLRRIDAERVNLERCYAKDADDICESTYEMVKCSVDKFSLFGKI